LNFAYEYCSCITASRIEVQAAKRDKTPHYFILLTDCVASRYRPSTIISVYLDPILFYITFEIGSKLHCDEIN